MVDATLEPSGPGNDSADLMRRHILTAGMPGLGKGGPSLSPLVATLLTENTALREQVESVTAELDAANDAVLDLIGQLDEARAGGGPR